MYSIFSEDKHGKQTITFFATDNYNPIFSFKKKKDELELEKPTSLSVLEQRRTLSFLDKVTFSVRI